MFRGMRASKSGLRKLNGVGHGSLTIGMLRLLVKGVTPRSNTADLGAVLEGQSAMFQQPVNA